MKILSCNIPNVSPFIFTASLGMSNSANELQIKTEELQRDLARSYTFGEHLSKMLEAIFEAKQKHSADNWDGYGAKSISTDSYQNAIRFALSLPSNIPIPEIYVDPDGEITFEWYEGRRQVFSVSVGGRSDLSYAGLYGASKTYGVEYIYDGLPEVILSNIYRLYAGVS